MKKYITNIILVLLFIITPIITLGSAPPPPPPGGPGTGETPIGGTAPIGSGVGILLVLGIAYGTRKMLVSGKED